MKKDYISGGTLEFGENVEDCIKEIKEKFGRY